MSRLALLRRRVRIVRKPGILYGYGPPDNTRSTRLYKGDKPYIDLLTGELWRRATVGKCWLGAPYWNKARN